MLLFFLFLRRRQDADDAALHGKAVLAEEAHGLGQEFPLRLFHDALLQDFRRVAFFHGHRLLQDNGACIGFGGDEVDRGAGELHAVFQGLFVDFQPIESVAAEGGDQGRVDVDDAVFIAIDESGGQDIEEACQDDQVGAQVLQLIEQSLREGFAAFVRLAVHHTAGHAGLGGPLQGKGPGVEERTAVILPPWISPRLWASSRACRFVPPPDTRTTMFFMAYFTTTASAPSVTTPRWQTVSPLPASSSMALSA